MQQRAPSPGRRDAACDEVAPANSAKGTGVLGCKIMSYKYKVVEGFLAREARLFIIRALHPIFGDRRLLVYECRTILYLVLDCAWLRAGPNRFLCAWLLQDPPAGGI